MSYTVESFAAYSRPIVKALRENVDAAEALYVELVTCGFARVTLRMQGLLIHQSGEPAGVYQPLTEAWTNRAGFAS